jgi:hypothetical protein
MDNSKLRGKVYERYKSIKQCNDAMNWPKHKLNRVISGMLIPDVNEIKQIGYALNLSQSELTDIFLPS